MDDKILTVKNIFNKVIGGFNNFDLICVDMCDRFETKLIAMKDSFSESYVYTTENSTFGTKHTFTFDNITLDIHAQIHQTYNIAKIIVSNSCDECDSVIICEDGDFVSEHQVTKYEPPVTDKVINKN